MKTPKLKPLPCPFCGTLGKVRKRYDTIAKANYHVGCPSEKCELLVRTGEWHKGGKKRLSREEAIDIWNRRIPAK